MTHHHNTHDHHCHHHSADHNESMSFDEKIKKIFEHWLKHNTDHAGTYNEWAQKARDNGLKEIGKILDEISSMTLEINKKFEQAIIILDK